MSPPAASASLPAVAPLRSSAPSAFQSQSPRSSKNSALTDAWLRLAQSGPKPEPPKEPSEPSLHPILQALRETKQSPEKTPEETPKETKQKTLQETPKKITIQDHYAFVLDRTVAQQRSMWNSETTWAERVCRQALPDHFETDPTYLRVPGLACPEPTCRPSLGSRSPQVQGLWMGPGGPLYVVHGCTQCGQRRLLTRDADMRVVYT